ncbi:NAD(P)-binding protein [Xylariaceae sp. FL0662B]|nr:NAD(P)-binding protein [Xylariaceae sp. FL0662B]
MATRTILISGTSRGLGRGILEIYLAKPNHTVIAANRNPELSSSKSLQDLPVGLCSRLIIVKVDAGVESDAADAVRVLTEKEGVDHVDLVIANAGIANIYPKVSELKISDLVAHLTPNVFGFIYLFQATLPLLLKSKNPTWVTMGSDAGCIQVRLCFSAYTVIMTQIPFPNAAYSITKIAVHWLTKKMNAEEEQLNAFVVNPGFCQTDLGNRAAHLIGLEKAFVPVEESCPKVVQLIDGATKESHGGKLWDYNGKEMVW